MAKSKDGCIAESGHRMSIAVYVVAIVSKEEALGMKERQDDYNRTGLEASHSNSHVQRSLGNVCRFPTALGTSKVVHRYHHLGL